MDYNTTFANYQSKEEQNRLTKQAENEAYLKSQAWKDQLEKAKQAKPKSYSCVFKDTDGELKEAWHFLSEDNIERVKNKYVQAKKEIVYFELMGLKDFGQALKEIKGVETNGETNVHLSLLEM